MTKTEIAARIEDLHWLDDNGCSLYDALQQTGLTASNLEKWCQRRGLAELFSRLRHRAHACTHHCLAATYRKAQRVDESPYQQGIRETMGASPQGAQTPAGTDHQPAIPGRG